MSGKIDYATPATNRRSYWPSTILCMTGLGLIFLAGCFLIGALSIVRSGGFGVGAQLPLSRADLVLLTFLYSFSFLCFVGSIPMFLLAIRKLG
ncbi:MAG: hypothetical protein QM770_11125 [Tepidisphaeraceae bacterium]